MSNPLNDSFEAVGVAAGEQLQAMLAHVQSAAQRLDLASLQMEAQVRYFGSRTFEAMILQAAAGNDLRKDSPWVSRAGAAAHVSCSVAQIDRVAARGIIRSHPVGGSPKFLKSEIDATLAAGQWAEILKEKNK